MCDKYLKHFKMKLMVAQRYPTKFTVMSYNGAEK